MSTCQPCYSNFDVPVDLFCLPPKLQARTSLKRHQTKKRLGDEPVRIRGQGRYWRHVLPLSLSWCCACCCVCPPCQPFSIQSVPLSPKPNTTTPPPSSLAPPLSPRLLALSPLSPPNPTAGPPPFRRGGRFPGDSARFGADSGLLSGFLGESAGIGTPGWRSGPLPLPSDR